LKNALKKKLKAFFKPFYRLSRPVILTPVRIFFKGLINYISFFKDLNEYNRLIPTKRINFREIYPQLFGKTSATKLDPHYFFQQIWAFGLIKQKSPKEHVDIGSKLDYVGMLSVITNVTFIDIRPINVKLDNFQSKAGSILNLPYPDNSIYSISCLHVIEHIGLGRYGDHIDPNGSKKAAKEITRVLAKNGYLYLSVPIGKPNVCFNAHRIFSPYDILSMFDKLTIKSFSVINDNGEYIIGANLEDYLNAKYACGLFCMVYND